MLLLGLHGVGDVGCDGCLGIASVVDVHGGCGPSTTSMANDVGDATRVGSVVGETPTAAPSNWHFMPP